MTFTIQPRSPTPLNQSYTNPKSKFPYKQPLLHYTSSYFSYIICYKYFSQVIWPYINGSLHILQTTFYIWPYNLLKILHMWPALTKNVNWSLCALFAIKIKSVYILKNFRYRWQMVMSRLKNEQVHLIIIFSV
jgi:hypothetical protein